MHVFPLGQESRTGLPPGSTDKFVQAFANPPAPICDGVRNLLSLARGTRRRGRTRLV
jgi:hypothetical protein